VRILFSLLDATDAGGQRVALAVARAAVDRGWSIGVLAPARGPATRAFAEIGGQFHPGDIHSLRNTTEVLAVGRILRNYDLLYSHTSIPGETLGGLAAWLAKKPHVIHRHTPARLRQSPAIRQVQQALYRAVLKDALVIAVSQQVRSSVMRLGADGDRVRVVPNGAPGWIIPVPPRPSGPIRVGMLGRIDPQKGIDVFLEATSVLGTLDAEFVVGGIGEAFPDYERAVRDRARQVGIAILDTGGRGIDFLSSLDVVVIPSRWEGSPLTLFEAMALQKAIVATDIPGISEVLRPHRAGLLVEPDDVGATSDAILRLVEDAELRMAVSLAARRRSTDYSEEHMVLEAVAALREAVKSHGRS
jgi:glycosyltransferase involved in cell wall biosynthesis